MKTKFAATALFIASAMLVGSPSFADVTRDQVKAELATAIRSGDIMAGESSLKLNEMYPGRYPVQQVQSGVTRAQVKSELVAALRNGDMELGNSSLKLNEMYPNLYPVNQVQSSVTRAEVKAELVSALRSGDYMAPGEASGLCNEVHPSMHSGV